MSGAARWRRLGEESSKTAEGTVSPATLTFTPANGKSPQTVTITGVNDEVADGNQPYTIVTANATSADPKYNNFDVDNVSVTNLDNDTAGIIVATTPLTTSETSTSAQFAVVLQSQPTADVTISVTSGDPTEGSVAPTSTTFTTVNWNAPQNITVTGVDDASADGNQVYLVVTTVIEDPQYLNQRWFNSSHFKKVDDGTWKPTACLLPAFMVSS